MNPRSASSPEKMCGVLVVALLLVLAAPPLAGQTTPATLKLAFFNIKSGKGQVALTGFPRTFADTSNCTDASQPLNAWGVGAVQAELKAKIGNDPSVISLGLAEAWPCATPAAVRAVLGWKAHSTERNGVAIVARHGFAGPERWTQLDTSLNLNPSDTMWVLRVPVCIDVACSSSVVVFTTHWYGEAATEAASALTYDTQAQQTVNFMNLVSNPGPQVLLGDLNVFAGTQVVCSQVPLGKPQQFLADAGYLDAWPSLNGPADGSTGMWNRAGCGTPSGNLYKRIDYSWSRGMSPLSMTRFGMVVPGNQAPSDHAGIIVEYPTPRTLMTSVPPAVAIKSPFAGAPLAGQVTIAVDARDDELVSRVELILDGQPLAVLWTPPFEYAWWTTKVPNGTHTLTAAAVDNAGNRTVSAVTTVNVQNTTQTSTAREIVLYASKASTIAGNWIVTPDATAAGGARLQNPNMNAPKVVTPLAVPSNYFELTFQADAGVAYRVWLRGKAQQDDYANDSVFVQFDRSVDAAGTPTARIGTAAAEGVVIENCGGCGLSGWGWQDNGYGPGVLGPAVYFAQSGTQRMRVQMREDGIGIDQVVLSAGKYLTTAPGATKDDATILGAAAPVVSTGVDEVVLYAAHAPLVAGAWMLVSDATAAGGARLQNPDAGAAKLIQPLAAPLNYFDLTFQAEAGKAYRLWVRGRAQDDYFGNDSLYVQFDRSVDAWGAPVSRIGTTLAETVVIENCGGCGLSGWGWQDNGDYGVDAFGPTIRFAQSGTQRVRIQVREDGVGVDQVVLSAVRYLTVSPGATKNDTTILQK